MECAVKMKMDRKTVTMKCEGCREYGRSRAGGARPIWEPMAVACPTFSVTRPVSGSPGCFWAMQGGLESQAEGHNKSHLHQIPFEHLL